MDEVTRAKEVLKNAGYFVDNFWTNGDVESLFSNVPKKPAIFKGNVGTTKSFLFYFRKRILSSQHAMPHDHPGGTAQSHSSFITLL